MPSALFNRVAGSGGSCLQDTANFLLQAGDKSMKSVQKNFNDIWNKIVAAFAKNGQISESHYFRVE